jgi:beta-glucanase (GH16 family)
MLCCVSATLAVLAFAPAEARPGTAPAQSVAVRALPQLAATSASPEPAAAALSTVVATFAPVTPGREAVLELQSGKKWVAVARSAQDGSGRATFNAPYTYAGVPATYRVTAARTNTAAQVTSTSVRTNAWGAPLLSDEFSRAALSAPWDHRYQGYDVPSRRCSRTDASAATVVGGVLALSVIDDPARDDLCTFTAGGVEQSTFYRLNGHVGTQGRFAYKYGVAAARIRFQDERGQHGAFWMQPAGTGYGAEVDVVEWFGNGSQGLINGVWDYSSGTQTRVAGGVVPDQGAYGSEWADTFHVFSAEWTPTEYIFRIDGREALRTTAGVAQTEEYLILSLLVANYEANKLPSPELLPQTMEVDWVRVWQ